MKGVWRWVERDIIYLSLHCHHQNDFCIKMGSDESHFNVSVGSDGQSHKTVSTNHNLFEEKGSRSGIEPRSFRLPALRLTARPNRLTKYVASFHSLISTQTFRVALTVSVDRRAEVKSAPSVA